MKADVAHTHAHAHARIRTLTHRPHRQPPVCRARSTPGGVRHHLAQCGLRPAPASRPAAASSRWQGEFRLVSCAPGSALCPPPRRDVMRIAPRPGVGSRSAQGRAGAPKTHLERRADTRHGMHVSAVCPCMRACVRACGRACVCAASIYARVRECMRVCAVRTSFILNLSERRARSGKSGASSCIHVEGLSRGAF